MATPILVNGTTGLSSTAIQVRVGPCRLKDLLIFNGAAAASYVQFFDSLLGPTVGTTVPTWSVGVGIAGMVQLAFMDEAGILFQNGLWVAATTGVGNSTAPSAAVTVNLGVQ